MTDWKPIESAPKDGAFVLLYGTPTPIDGLSLGDAPIILSGYWDLIDQAWCSTTSTWMGPFIDATHWMPLPEPPK